MSNLLSSIFATAIFGVFIVFLGWGGGYYLVNYFSFMRSASFAQGVVASLKEIGSDTNSGDGVSSFAYYPVVAFTDKNNTQVTFTGTDGSYPAAYQVGDKVTVAYQTDNSRDAAIKSSAHLWVGSIMIAIAVLMLIFTILLDTGSLFRILKKETDYLQSKQSASIEQDAGHATKEGL